MTVHPFVLHVAQTGVSADRFDGFVDRLWGGGHDDSSPGMCDGHVSVAFDREAASLEDAVRSAVAAVRSAGLEVDRVEIDRDDLAILMGEKAVGDFLPSVTDAPPPADPELAAAAGRPGRR